MKKIASVALFLLASLLAGAQKFDYNVNFDYMLSNYEYGLSRYFVGDESFYPYQHSHTVHGVRLTPEAGLLLAQNASLFHRLRIGIDLVKLMGEQQQTLGVFREVLLYYNLESVFSGGGRLELFAGSFPRRCSSGKGYLGPVYDREYAWLDPNLEGFLVKYSREGKIRAELSLDWPGMLGDAAAPGRREHFQVLSDGQWRFAGDFSFLWTMSLTHYSKSLIVDNVVDYRLLYPRLEWAPFSWMDELRFDLGGIFTHQADRVAGTGSLFPMGFLGRQEVGKWGVRLSNAFYWGDDLMPLSYGRELYPCEPGFRTLHSSPSWADWLTLSYQPKIAKWLSAEVAVTLHVGQPVASLGVGVFRGSDQRICVKVDLQALRPHPKAPKKSRNKAFML